MAKPFEFPDWLSGAGNNSELEAQYAGLGDAFNTQGLEDSYEQQFAYNRSDSRARGNAMAAAAQSRARRNGGQVAASFAAGSANLGAMRQNAAMLQQLQQLKLQGATQRAQLGAQIAGQLSGARQGQAGLQSNFYNASQDRTQQESQFGRSLNQNESQYARSLEQSGSQFDRSFAQDDSQFGQNLDYQNRALSQSGSQFNRSFAAQNQNDLYQRMQSQLTLTPNVPLHIDPIGTPGGVNNTPTANAANSKRLAIIQRMNQLNGF